MCTPRVFRQINHTKRNKKIHKSRNNKRENIKHSHKRTMIDKTI